MVLSDVDYWNYDTRLQTIGKMMHSEISEILKDPLQFMPSCFLLHVYTNKKHVTLLNNFSAAQKLIPKNWKTDIVPTKKEW